MKSQIANRKSQNIVVYTDGGSRGNPGPAGIGVYIEKGPEKIRAPRFYSEYIREATNNEAEYKAVIFALKKIKLLAGKDSLKDIPVEIRMDSELIAQQLNNQYKILEKNLQTLFLEIHNLKIDFGEINFVYIKRESNREADKLVNEELNKQEQKLFSSE